MTIMKREIKFRAWDSYQGKMYEWNEITEMDDKGYLTLSNLLNNLIEHITPLGFTGLKDKNGKEIYFGDILNHKTAFENNMADLRFQSRTEIEVGFKNGCFIDVNTGINLYDKIYSFVSHKIDFEIIRNIHEG